MENKTIGNILIITIIVAMVMGMLEIDLEGLYLIIGLMMMIFGIWGGLRLKKK